MTNEPWREATSRMLTRIQDTAERVTSGFPHWAHNDTGQWTTTPDGDWTGGYWTGMLWLAATASGDPRYRPLAEPLAEPLRARIDAETVFTTSSRACSASTAASTPPASSAPAIRQIGRPGLLDLQAERLG